jgi:hypothetical protein
MSENDPYRRDQYKSTKKAALVTMLLSTQDRERDLNARLQSSTDEQGRMASKRQTDEAKIHQLQTALDAAVRARTQALEEVQSLRQRSWREDTRGEVGALLQTNLKDLRDAMGLLAKVIK